MPALIMSQMGRLSQTGERPQFSGKRTQLTTLMGPMAAFVLEEQVAALGDVGEAFPPGKARELVERLAAEIEDEDKRARFRQAAR